MRKDRISLIHRRLEKAAALRYHIFCAKAHQKPIIDFIDAMISKFLFASNTLRSNPEKDLQALNWGICLRLIDARNCAERLFCTADTQSWSGIASLYFAKCALQSRQSAKSVLTQTSASRNRRSIPI